MLPHDDDGSAEARPSDQPMPDATPTPPDATGDQPAPTGLIDQPVLPPVAAPPSSAAAAGRSPRRWSSSRSWAARALFMSGYTVGRDSGLTPAGEASEADAWKPFWSVYTFIRDRYPLEPVERNTLIEGAIRGMVESVGDPYSSYLSPEDFQGTLNDISGTFEGIGAEIGAVDDAGNASDCATFGPNCHLVVIAPIDGSPAEAAGLRPGDVIVAVDGSTLDGLTPDEARDRVRGKAGTEVTLHILRYEAPVPAPTDAGASPAPSAGARAEAACAPRGVRRDDRARQDPAPRGDLARAGRRDGRVREPGRLLERGRDAARGRDPAPTSTTASRRSSSTCAATRAAS